MWQRSTTRRFFAWLVSPRTLKRGAIAFGWMAALIALYYGVVDWKGRHDWNEFRRSYETRVGSLNFRDYIPKPVPDSENFAATATARSWFAKNDKQILFAHDSWVKAYSLLHTPKEAPAEPKPMDLVAWQEALDAIHSHAAQPAEGFRSDKLDLASRAQAAPTVLEAMKDDDAALDELRAASDRPESRYDVKYDTNEPWATLLPHLAHVKQTCQRLQTRACAELAVGQSQSALDDVLLSLRMVDSLKTEPTLISYLVSIAAAQLTLQPVWEGLAEHRWKAEQLQQLQSKLVDYNFLAALQFPLHAECAMGTYAGEFIKKRGLGTFLNLTEVASAQGVMDQIGRIVPAGWYDEEIIHYATLDDNEFRGAMDVSAKRVFPRQVAANTEDLKKLAVGPWQAIWSHLFIARVMLPSLTRLPIKSAAAQTRVDEAAIACALERYRLANGHFPENLPALTPQFMAQLPNDVITGDSFKYRTTPDGQFVLYSVGWDEKDDGGTPGKTMFDEKNGDWVWQYPPTN